MRHPVRHRKAAVRKYFIKSTGLTFPIVRAKKLEQSDSVT